MDNLISRQAAINAAIYAADDWDGGCNINRSEMIEKAINGLPPEQPEIIRCKDCKYYNVGFECLIEGYGIETDPNHYCGYAELRDDAPIPARTVKENLKYLPPAQPAQNVKPISYQDCANAMLMMWIDKVLTDGEYYRIMNKLNAHEKKMEEGE